MERKVPTKYDRPGSLAPNQGDTDPHPLLAMAVGLLYVFRTRPGLKMMRELEAAIRHYARDPRALFDLMRGDQETIDTTLSEPPRELPDTDQGPARPSNQVSGGSATEENSSSPRKP